MVKARVLLLWALAVGCGHARPVPQPNLSSLRKSAESYHRMLRWGDLRSAAGLVAEERRAEVLADSLADEDRLKVTEYELVDAQAQGQRASVLSKVTWHRLPSTTLRSDPVTTRWEARAGRWVIVAIEGGPLPLLSAAAPPPAPAGGVAPVPAGDAGVAPAGP